MDGKENLIRRTDNAHTTEAFFSAIQWAGNSVGRGCTYHPRISPFDPRKQTIRISEGQFR